MSCRTHKVSYSTGKLLDEHMFLEQKKKWQALNIKNYTFTYVFEDNMTSKRFRQYKGTVVVQDGVGSITFEKKAYFQKVPNKNKPDERLFYITSIDEAFEKILLDYQRLKKIKDEGIIDYLDADYVIYRDIYFYLVNIRYTALRPSNALGPRYMYFTITDFEEL